MIHSLIKIITKKNGNSVYLWNMIGGLLNAGQSAFLLIVISRVLPADDSGIYALAYAIASLALTLGMFGIRHYQASDVKEKYSFAEYKTTRIVTSVCMIILILYYILKGYLFGNYSVHKIVMILLAGLLKLVDAVEDVFHGRLQQNDRLDLAAKSIAVRYLFTILSIIISILVTKNLNLSLAIGLMVSMVVFSVTYSIYYQYLKDCNKKNYLNGNVWKLLGECLVVSVGNFVMIYIANAPKYSIDKYMNETIQAYFNYIFMPVYVVSTLSFYIFQPTINQMANYLERKEKNKFQKEFIKQIIIISIISIGVLGLGNVIGITALGWLYHVDLSIYKLSFMILLIGGCVLSFSTFFSVCIIIIRKQVYLLIGYLIPLAVSLFFSDYFVQQYGVEGAGILYLVIVLLQMIIFLLIFIIGVKKTEWSMVQ